MKEQAVQKYLIDNLQSLGHYAAKVTQTAYSRRGIPDLLCCIDGRFVGIEVKVKGGKQSPLQKYEADKIKDSLGIALCVTGMDEAIGFITAVRERKDPWQKMLVLRIGFAGTSSSATSQER